MTLRPYDDPTAALRVGPTLRPYAPIYIGAGRVGWRVEGVIPTIPALRMKMKLTATAAALVPLDVAFADGQRYRMAGATEARSRLDLYVADPAGPWIRLHGVLISFSRL